MNITSIVEQAKEHIVEHGEHLPTLYVECGNEVTVILFADFPYKTTFEKEKVFFGLGRKLGLQSPEKDISQLIFVVEAWVASYRKDEEIPAISPSQDPNRQEVLMIAILEADKPHITQSMEIVDMIRDGGGTLIDLYHRPHEDGTVKSPLLTSFLAGFETTKLSPEAFARMVEKAVRGK